MQQLKDWFVYFLVRLFIALIQALRMETCHAIARGIAILANDIIGLRRKVIDENIQGAFPQLSDRQRRRLARRMWEHLILMVCEIAHAPLKIHDTNYSRYISFSDRRRLVGYLLDSRPLVLLTGHYGNFETAGYITGLLGFPTFTIARPLDNPHLDRYVNRFRGAKGQYILPKIGSAPLVEVVLKSGGILSLLADQYAGHKGRWVEFLGRPASYHKALAIFSMTSGAPVLVIYARRIGKPMHLEIGVQGVADPQTMEPSQISVPGITQWYNDMLEQIVRDDPRQYWWLHRRWKGKPPKRFRKDAGAGKSAADSPKIGRSAA